MPDIGAWLSGGTTWASIDAPSRAASAWQRIQDKPSSITIIRSGVTPFTQTVRLEYWRGGAVQAEAGTVAVTSVTVFGVKDHPVEDDTDLQRGDRFVIDDSEYEIISMSEYPGEIQASAEQLS